MNTIIFTQNSQTPTFTAQVTTQQDNGALTRFYNDLDKKALHVSASFLPRVEELVYLCRAIQEKAGRAYSVEKDELFTFLAYKLGTSFYIDVTSKRPDTIKSKAQLDTLCEELIIAALKILAKVERVGDYTCKQPEVIKANIPALINSISEGKEPLLTGKQARQITEIAERKLRKRDTTANWEKVRVYALLNN